MSDLYTQVPKDIAANLRYRAELVKMGKDKSAAEELWIACSRDLLFFCNAFCWTYDPRLPHKVIPFITWDYQDKILNAMLASLGKEHLLIRKSRDMGVSWMGMLFFAWQFQFRDMASFLVASKVEDDVDKTSDPKALMWKIDFLHRYLPPFLQPQVERRPLSVTNLENGSTITGTATTVDLGRGDRKTAIWMDEFAAFEERERGMSYKAWASVRHATNSVFLCSTPRGQANAMYELSVKKEIPEIVVHWARHPHKSVGLYLSVEGKTRSPWYDRECKQAIHPLEIKQELDCEFEGAAAQFFDANQIDKHIKDYARDPYLTGELNFDLASCKPESFMEQANGRLVLWMLLDTAGKPAPEADFVVSCDVATGTGASNSVISIVNRVAREKVGEFTSQLMEPSELARLAVALCHFFNDARLIWEVNGPGNIFSNHVRDIGYSKLYMRRDEKSITREVKDQAGWYTTRDTKKTLLADYKRALAMGEFINRCAAALAECKEYIYDAGGRIEHSRSMSTYDPSASGDNHGDRVIADAMAWHDCKSTAPKRREPDEPLPYSLAWRRQEREAKRRDKAFW